MGERLQGYVMFSSGHFMNIDVKNVDELAEYLEGQDDIVEMNIHKVSDGRQEEAHE